MTDQEMKEILKATLVAQSKNATYRESKRPNKMLSAPVTPGDLSRLEKHVARLGVKVPPSFVQFLRLTDGIVDYMQLNRLSLRSAKQIVASQAADRDRDDLAPLHEFIIASGNTREFIAFDSSRVKKSGEMRVVWIDLQAKSTKFADFPEFLSEQLEFQQIMLAANEGDRADLPDD